MGSGILASMRARLATIWNGLRSPGPAEDLPNGPPSDLREHESDVENWKKTWLEPIDEAEEELPDP